MTLRPRHALWAPAILSTALVVFGVGFVIIPSGGFPVPIAVLWSAAGLWPLLVAVRSKAVASPDEIVVTNPLRTRRFAHDEIRSLQVVRVTSNWNTRRPVDGDGFQRLRLEVIGPDGDPTTVVASQRFSPGTGTPPEFSEFAESAGVPLRVYRRDPGERRLPWR
ncbi:MAG: hypothetical protein U0Q22_06755 [Acidimicrobiales bacterium]